MRRNRAFQGPGGPAVQVELPSRWLVLSVESPPHGEEILLVEALRGLGGRVVERQGERFVTYLPAPRDPDAVIRAAAVAVRGSTSLREPSISWSWEPNEAVAARWSRSLQPRRVSARIVVTPQGQDREMGEGEVVVRLVPGAAFGTAEHATTRACLRFLDDLLQPGTRIADVGAGSGILAVAAALLGAQYVLALEADGYACAAARENVRLNGVLKCVEVRQVEVGPGNIPLAGRLDGIVANLHAAILLPLLPGLAGALRADGWLIVSGILPSERGQVMGALAEHGWTVGGEDLEEGWWSAWFRTAHVEHARSTRRPVDIAE